MFYPFSRQHFIGSACCQPPCGSIAIIPGFWSILQWRCMLVGEARWDPSPHLDSVSARNNKGRGGGEGRMIHSLRYSPLSLPLPHSLTLPDFCHAGRTRISICSSSGRHTFIWTTPPSAPSKPSPPVYQPVKFIHRNVTPEVLLVQDWWSSTCRGENSAAPLIVASLLPLLIRTCEFWLGVFLPTAWRHAGQANNWQLYNNGLMSCRC